LKPAKPEVKERSIDFFVRNPMRFFILCFALLIGASSSLPAFAQEKVVPPLPAPLKTMVEEGAQIRYLGNDLGLDGWVTIKNAQEQYFYVTPDQQGLVMGVLFNSKGDTVTLRQINQLRKAEGPQLTNWQASLMPPLHQVGKQHLSQKSPPQKTYPKTHLNPANRKSSMPKLRKPTGWLWAKNSSRPLCVY
jgi:hypothetical protein